MYMYLMLFLTILFENLSLAHFWPFLTRFWPFFTKLHHIVLSSKMYQRLQILTKNLKFGRNDPDICTKKCSIDFLIFLDFHLFQGVSPQNLPKNDLFLKKMPRNRGKSRNIKKSILTFFCTYIRVILAKFQVFWSKFVGGDTFYVKVQ